MPSFREPGEDESVGLGDGGTKGWWDRGMTEVWIVKVYWFGLDPTAFPGRKTVPRGVGAAKPRDGALR